VSKHTFGKNIRATQFLGTYHGTQKLEMASKKTSPSDVFNLVKQLETNHKQSAVF
jgi:hypothetical protein